MNQQYVESSNDRLSAYIDGAATFIRALCAAGGPEPEKHSHVAQFSYDIHQAVQAGLADDAEKLAIRQTFGQTMGLGTMQGRAWLKPHGYAGDFQIIDDIYINRISDRPELRSWDELFMPVPHRKLCATVRITLNACWQPK